MGNGGGGGRGCLRSDEHLSAYPVGSGAIRVLAVSDATRVFAVSETLVTGDPMASTSTGLLRSLRALVMPTVLGRFTCSIEITSHT
jgi:hypothetical protein